MEEKKCGRPRKLVDERNKKKSICIYLKPEIYEILMVKHNTSFIPISKLVELAIEKEYK